MAYSAGYSKPKGKGKGKGSNKVCATHVKGGRPVTPVESAAFAL